MSQNTENEIILRPEMLVFCAVGIILSLGSFGVLLEYSTADGRNLDEIGFLFLTASISTVVAYAAKYILGEPSIDHNRYQIFILSFTSFSSMYTSLRSLRYVIFPVQVLFHTCKPVSVILFSTLFGRRYKAQKYLYVTLTMLGVFLFTSGRPNSDSEVKMSMIGTIMLLISLGFEGATSAYQEKLMGEKIRPFDLMYNMQMGKMFIAFFVLIYSNKLSSFLQEIYNGKALLIALGLTGSIGQMFIIVTISQFGALNTSMIGLLRKVITFVLSFVLYSHPLNTFQTLGLLLAISGLLGNFVDSNYAKRVELLALESKEGKELVNIT